MPLKVLKVLKVLILQGLGTQDTTSGVRDI